MFTLINGRGESVTANYRSDLDYWLSRGYALIGVTYEQALAALGATGGNDPSTSPANPGALSDASVANLVANGPKTSAVLRAASVTAVKDAITAGDIAVGGGMTVVAF